MFVKTFYFILILLLCSANLRAEEKDSHTPKVVFGIVIENMRPDYIDRFWNKFGEDGFKKIYSEGTVCSNVKLTLHKQNYASGTATLFTGVSPSMHGIVAEEWYDCEKKEVVSCTKDDSYKTIGSNSDQGEASPKKLASMTITDILKITTGGKSKVYSIALNPESSIFAGGHAADGAFWFDTQSGRMVSSTFYYKYVPDWVRYFNSENYADIYSHRTWATLLSEADYKESLPDNYILERGYFGEYNTFPHTISKYIERTSDFRPFKTTPAANQMIKDFAIKLIDNEDIGKDNATDFVTTVFSSMDYENGSFGPASVEMEDSYLYLDKYIGELIDSVETKLGKDNVLFFLAANTSASYPVEYLKEDIHIPVDYFNIENAIALLSSYLNITYGDAQWIEHYSDLQLYFDHDLIKKGGNVSLDEISNTASKFMNQFEGVQISIPAFQLEQGASDNELLRPLFDSYYTNRSGDVLYNLKEGWQPGYKFKRSNYTDQSKINIVFFGKGIEKKTINTIHNATDFAPTLSELINIPFPDKCQGEAIREITNKSY
jgi:predicted AlkP superfamily pyrophosphatase or phosphodiesterase